MGRSRYDPEAIFQRAVRRALRDHVAKTGQVPALVCAVSDGSSPRKVTVSTRLDLLEDNLAVKGYVQGEIRERGSYYAAIGGLTRGQERFALAVVSLDRAEMWSAPVSAEEGLGAWERGGAELPEGWAFVQAALEAVPRV